MSKTEDRGKPLGNPYDINGTYFNPDMYLQKILKESSLKQVMDKETEVVRDTQSLHSEMQTLVYENYNKFISATDTIRKMKSDFKKMEDEMDMLAKNMGSITSFSESISSTLQDTRQQISKLSGVHTLLKRLQFLFKLPSKLKLQMEEGNYSEAVRDYLHTQRVLEQYGNLESFQGIQQDCNAILKELMDQLRNKFKSQDCSAKEVAESIDLLLQLSEPAEVLCAEFLNHSESRLNTQLQALKISPGQDIIEFVDLGSSGFLSDLCFVATSFTDMFVNKSNYHDDEMSAKLSLFVKSKMDAYLEVVQWRVELEQEVGDTAMLVRALDRFHRRLTAINSLTAHADFAMMATEIVIRAGRRQCRSHLHTLKAHLADSLTSVRQSLAAPRLTSQEASTAGLSTELVTSLVLSTVEKIKGVLQDLKVFLQPELAFMSKRLFVESFCAESVRECLVVGFMHHLTATARSFTAPHSALALPCPTLALLLILTKMCLEFEATSVHYLLKLTDEWFNVEEHCGQTMQGWTDESEICTELRSAAQDLVNHYVRMQGLAISQMLRKSVETRVPSRSRTFHPLCILPLFLMFQYLVISVLQGFDQVVNSPSGYSLCSVCLQVGMLFEEGSRAERSSDSSRKTHSRHQHRSLTNWSSHSHSMAAAAATHIHKLFSERIEIFAPVEFSKVSILTGIIKISLKTFLECVRLRTFSKYGLQQIQVDTHYLQLYLWRFVADENLVHFLLDEILGSAINRCLDPVLMEPSVVEIICERI
ncbi:vacuolar protein sorting-associated protein 51 homolog [Nilaparvata lugens]|uniref:vacuolar protein sorting-associated protein 51 homolog n=1 Tax=Nilaparvata lugens TaxID=108931 RepID=UPI00193CE06C|nr:vacuolar protein sorting-associated protein 51 homolog [Nilaparvata lugens]